MLDHRSEDELIEASPEMIRAGIEAYSEFYLDLKSESANVAEAEKKMVVSVFLAMTRLSEVL